MKYVENSKSRAKLLELVIYLNSRLLKCIIIYCAPVTEQTQGWGSEQYTITRRTPHFFSRGSPQPTRFALPTTRGKASLNTRDW